MGVVYLAMDPLLNRQVGRLKTVDLALDDPQERDFLRDRLMRDARSRCVPPSSTQTLSAFHETSSKRTGGPMVVMEYVEGERKPGRAAQG